MQKFIRKLTSCLKNHRRNLDNFRQAVESPKIWNSMGYICPKNTFLQLKHCMQRIYFTFDYLCENSPNCWCHFWNHKVIFHDATRMYYFSSNITYFWQKYSIKVQIFRFLTIQVKIHQISLVIFQAKSEFFQSLDHSSVSWQITLTFSSKTLYDFDKRNPSSANFQTFNCSHEN